MKPISVSVGPISLRSALAKHADVLAPVHRGALEALAAFATDPNQAVRLRRLASPDGKAEFQAWAVGPGRTLLEAMQEFPSATPPLGKDPSLESLNVQMSSSNTSVWAAGPAARCRRQCRSSPSPSRRSVGKLVLKSTFSTDIEFPSDVTTRC